MATVYLAEDLKQQRKVALRVLRPELAAILGAERFLHEIRTTANLQHPHILPLHDSGQVESTVFDVMPFVEGESVRDRLDPGGRLRSCCRPTRIALSTTWPPAEGAGERGTGGRRRETGDGRREHGGTGNGGTGGLLLWWRRRRQGEAGDKGVRDRYF